VIGSTRAPRRVGIAERWRALADPRLGRLVGDALLAQPLPPVAKRVPRNDESGFDDHAVAIAARRPLLPGEEGQRRARPAGLVAVVEMPRGGIIEIDGFLDHAQAEAAGVEDD